ncbi:helix-turn-helix transcriptional regulator, partial [Pseudonocardia sp.]|uniref:helix-turn-helix domain-containing protein n=1 Tax=Pseudonocardia sp. TaxID=60912 RepID=UPI0031FC878A
MSTDPLAAPDTTRDASAGWKDVVGSIGPKVRALRRERGLTLQQLAHAADVSTASVHKVERGDMVPTVTTLLKIAGALGVPVRLFVEDSEPSQAVHTRFGD